jgi:hypothetical protein
MMQFCEGEEGSGAGCRMTRCKFYAQLRDGQLATLYCYPLDIQVTVNDDYFADITFTVRRTEAIIFLRMEEAPQMALVCC